MMEMKTLNTDGIVSITQTRTHVHHVHCGVSLVVTLRLRHFHPIENSRHAGMEALTLSQYATFDGIQFTLRFSDCICQPCYKTL